jgi:methyl-accepting chemotaxis protein
MKQTLFENRSLRSITLLGGLVCAILPAAILAVGSIVAIRSWTLHEEVIRAEAHAKSLALLLDQELSEQQRTVTVLGQTTKMLGTITAETLAPVLQQFHAAEPVIDRVSVTNKEGLIIASDPPRNADGTSSVGVSIADRPYFAQALARPAAFVNPDVIRGKTSGLLNVIITGPMYGPSGQPEGVIVATMSVNDLQDVIGNFKYGTSGHAGVTSNKGIVIAHENTTLVEQQADFSKQPIWQFMGSNASGAIDSYQDELDHERVGGFYTVPTIGWKVWVSRRVSEIDQEITASYADDLLWVAIAILLALGLAFLLARHLAKPIDALRLTAGRIAQGDLGTRAPVEGPLEIVELSKAVNTMAEGLERSLTTERTSKESLERSVQEFAGLAARVAAGDLTARVTEGQEGALGQLGGSLNRMTASLAQLVLEIRGATKSVAAAAAEILAATSQQVSATAEEATAVRQTATTVAEVRQTAEAAARRTRMVAELAQRVATTAEDGRKSVEESIKGSDTARTRMEALAERILSFSEQAEAIADINATVGELAEQSNLLAVNAGIEAAKAGEAGKGFAVVAAEVKGLAERCKEATTQVRRIVIDLQKSAQTTVIAAEQGVKAAESGTATAQRSGEAISALATSVTEASQAAQQIMAAAEQQEAGMDQIALAIQNIEQSSAQTVAAMQQVERATKDLNDLAQRLSETVQSSVAAA